MYASILESGGGQLKKTMLKINQEIDLPNIERPDINTGEKDAESYCKNNKEKGFACDFEIGEIAIFMSFYISNVKKLKEETQESIIPQSITQVNKKNNLNRKTMIGVIVFISVIGGVIGTVVGINLIKKRSKS